jgi:hypothetical protein
MIAGGLTWMIRDKGKRRSALIAETAIGALAAVGGFASLFATTSSFNELNRQPVWTAGDPDVSIRLGGHAVSMVSLGLGVGLLTSSLIGLRVQRKHTSSLRAGALTGPGQAGVTLSGAF